MTSTYSKTVFNNFLGASPGWFKLVILGLLFFNPLLAFFFGKAIAAWFIVAEFIFCLFMSLKCYPLQPGGLIAIQAVIMDLTTPYAVYLETKHNFQIIMLLMFMVAAIYFMKDFLMLIFSTLVYKVKNKITLSLLFCLIAAILSAFLDALTVSAVIISVGVGLYGVYHKVISNNRLSDDVHKKQLEDLESFRNFLCSLLMHAAIGTALGGVCTLVGEPQNLMIAASAHWSFVEFFLRMSPVTIPVFFTGLLLCVILEKLKLFGYGVQLPPPVRQIIREYLKEQTFNLSKENKLKLLVQGFAGIWLIFALGFHIAEIGIIGLVTIVLLTSFNGIIEEHALGKAFSEALPFTALLVVFFAIVSVIHEQHLFEPIITSLLTQWGDSQIILFYLANGIFSIISDNVFVASVYMGEVVKAYDAGIIDYKQFSEIAVAINTGTNIPSIATPNGQAAFLFILTSTIAPLIRLSYQKMIWMALPYTLVLSTVGVVCLYNFLPVVTNWFIASGYL